MLDEADQMLDLGFIHADPPHRRDAAEAAPDPAVLGDHAEGDRAASPTSCCAIRRRSRSPPVATTVEKVDQRVVFVDSADKRDVLTNLLRDPRRARASSSPAPSTAPTGSRSHLEKRRHRRADAIHGNKSQDQRERALDGFRAADARVLVATDIAARGIDVDGVTHVVNFELPNVPENYVHRIGRTARAGAAGMAISFCAGDERAYLSDIEKVIRRRIWSDRYEGKGRMVNVGHAAELPPAEEPRPVARQAALRAAARAAQPPAPPGQSPGDRGRRRPRSSPGSAPGASAVAPPASGPPAKAHQCCGAVRRMSSMETSRMPAAASQRLSVVSARAFSIRASARQARSPSERP